MLAEDIVLSVPEHQLLQDSARGDGVPISKMTPPRVVLAGYLVRLDVAHYRAGHFVATPRGRIVSLAEWEEAADGMEVRIRAGSLWASNLAEEWVALEYGWPRPQVGG